MICNCFHSWFIYMRLIVKIVTKIIVCDECVIQGMFKSISTLHRSIQGCGTSLIRLTTYNSHYSGWEIKGKVYFGRCWQIPVCDQTVNWIHQEVFQQNMLRCRHFFTRIVNMYFCCSISLETVTQIQGFFLAWGETSRSVECLFQ